MFPSHDFSPQWRIHALMLLRRQELSVYLWPPLPITTPFSRNAFSNTQEGQPHSSAPMSWFYSHTSPPESVWDPLASLSSPPLQLVLFQQSYQHGHDVAWQGTVTITAIWFMWITSGKFRIRARYDMSRNFYFSSRQWILWLTQTHKFLRSPLHLIFTHKERLLWT